MAPVHLCTHGMGWLPARRLCFAYTPEITFALTLGQGACQPQNLHPSTSIEPGRAPGSLCSMHKRDVLLLWTKTHLTCACSYVFACTHPWHVTKVVGPLGLRTYMLPLCKAVLKQALLFSFYVNMHKRSPTCAHTHRHTHTPFQDPLASLAAKRGMGRAALGC
eukprot:scaffold239102_cov24-Tisochrysis_lutea.AAC.1